MIEEPSKGNKRSPAHRPDGWLGQMRDGGLQGGSQVYGLIEKGALILEAAGQEVFSLRANSHALAYFHETYTA
jgi:hypothetical protein